MDVETRLTKMEPQADLPPGDTYQCEHCGTRLRPGQPHSALEPIPHQTYRAVMGTAASMLLALLLVGCDAPVSTSQAGPARDERGSVSCTYPGFCYTCGVDMDLKLSCGFRLSLSCEGRRPATVRVTPMRTTYESGAVRDWEQRQAVAVDPDGHCR